MQENNASTFLPAAILLAAIILGGSLIYAAVTIGGAKGVAGIGSPLGAEKQGEAPNQQGFPETFSVDLEGWPSKGSLEAPVTIVEYSDFACPFCGKFWKETLPQITKEYIDTGKVRFVYKDFPVVGGEKAAEASHCAEEQGKYWEYHDMLFANQEQDRGNWASVSVHEGYARDLGMNVAQLTECFESSRYQEKVAVSARESAQNGGTGTPFFLINNTPIVGAQPFANFQQIIEQELSL